MPVNLVCKDLSLDHVPPIEAILAEIVDDIFLPWHAAAAVLLSGSRAGGGGCRS